MQIICKECFIYHVFKHFADIFLPIPCHVTPMHVHVSMHSFWRQLGPGSVFILDALFASQHTAVSWPSLPLAVCRIRNWTTEGEEAKLY